MISKFPTPAEPSMSAMPMQVSLLTPHIARVRGINIPANINAPNKRIRIAP